MYIHPDRESVFDLERSLHLLKWARVGFKDSLRSHSRSCVKTFSFNDICLKFWLFCVCMYICTLYVYKLELNCSTYACSTDLPTCIGSIGWSLGPQNLEGLQPRCMIFSTLLLDFHSYDVITYIFFVLFFLNNPSAIFHFRIVQNFKHLIIFAFIEID